MTDQALLALLRQDPERGIAALVDHYGALAAAIAGRVLPGRQADIEEVTADVMVKLWQTGERLRAETLRGFVITTARNLAIDRWRILRRRAEVPLFDGDQDATVFLEQDVRLLAEDIRALSPPDGELFLRHHMLLETAAEIAARFGLTESAVRSRLHRTRKLLQKEVPL